MKSKLKKYGHFRWKVLLTLLALLAIAIGGLESKIAFKILIDGDSMSPSYKDRDLVWASSLYSNINKDDVVVARLEEHTIIKRVRFVPGDTFWVIKFDTVHWSPIPDDTIDDFKKINIWNMKKIVVPKNMYWLEGDNKSLSYDSRLYGLFESKNIIGLVLPSLPNEGKEEFCVPLNRMKNLKKQGVQITREKFINNNVFKP